MLKMNAFLLIFLGLWCTSASAQQSELLKLPFGMELGKTTAEEIENYGVCQEKIKIREDYFRCKRYLVNERFTVYMSQNERVNRIWFNLRYIPRNWKRLGFVKGVSEKDFISLIESLGAKYIEKIGSDPNDFGIEFVVGNYLYKASIYDGYFDDIGVSLSY